MKKRYSCIIVDDSLIDSTILETYIATTERVELIGNYNNAIDAIKGINELNPDILLTDIEMPDCTGIELIKSLAIKPLVVLLSNHREFGVEAYEAEVFNYLIKPITIDKYTGIINKIINKLDETSAGGEMFIIRSESQYTPIRKSDITYIEAVDKFVKIYLSNGQHHIVWISLKSINEQLADKRFMRIHRSYVINTEQIQSINNTDVKVGNKTLPLSEQFKHELFDRYVKKHLIKK